MGLDMYLMAKVYVGAKYEPRNVKGAIDITVGDKKLPVDFKKVSYVTMDVGYWRKANHIHNYFVNVIGDGEDNCQPIPCDIEQLEELMDCCLDVRTNENVDPEEELPTASGFFFGGTDYDKYYFIDIEDTLQILQTCIDLEEDCDFEYQASW